MTTGGIDGDDMFLEAEAYGNGIVDFVSLCQTTGSQPFPSDFDDLFPLEDSNFFDNGVSRLTTPIKSSVDCEQDGIFLPSCMFQLDDMFTSEDQWPI